MRCGFANSSSNSTTCLQEIARNEKLAEGARGEFARVVYCRRMETYRHWKEVLVRILAGKENDE